MDEIIIIGSGGHARSCIDVIECSGLFRIAGLVEKNNNNRKNNSGYSIIGSDNDLPKLRLKYKYALVAVGQIKSPKTRLRLFNMLLNLKYTLPVIISPKAYVSKNSNISSGSIIMHDVIINSNASVGRNCIINSKALIEHDAFIGNNCHIATGAIINGKVRIDDNTFIGSGVITKQSIQIGNNCVIGAGSVLKENISSNQMIK